MSIFKSSQATVSQGDTQIVCTDSVDFSTLPASSLVVIQGNKILVASGGSGVTGTTSTITLDEPYPATFPNVSNVDIVVIAGYSSVIAAVASAKLVSDNMTTTRNALQAIIDAQGTAAEANLVTSPTDTTAGRVLTTGYGGLGATDANPFPNTSLNNVSGLGTRFYGGFLASITTTDGWPINASSVNYTLLHEVERENSGVQTLNFQRIDGVGSNLTYKRNFYTNNFSVWVEVFDSGNNGGIETGENANGRYTKYPDGTLICTVSLTSSSSSAVRWTFPASFLSTSYLSVTGAIATSSATESGSVNPHNLTNTYVDFNSVRDSTGRIAATTFLTAIGKWK